MNGHYYSEEAASETSIDRFYRTEYNRMDMVFSLASFDLKRRKEELFQNNRQMKNITELAMDIDSFQHMVIKQKSNFIQTTQRYFDFHFENKNKILKKGQLIEEEETSDSLRLEASIVPISLLNKLVGQEQKKIGKVELPLDSLSPAERRRRRLDLKEEASALKNKLIADDKMKLAALNVDTLEWADLNYFLDSVGNNRKPTFSEALNKARNVKVNLNSAKTRLYQYQKDANLYTIEMQKKYAQALACILMFLVGAPLGAIIKKGGLGVPTIIAIFFFIIYYVFSSIGEKQAKEGAMDPIIAAWMSDAILLPFGLFFLRQARVDARLFEVDAYRIGIEKLMRRFARNKNKA